MNLALIRTKANPTCRYGKRRCCTCATFLSIRKQTSSRRLHVWNFQFESYRVLQPNENCRILKSDLEFNSSTCYWTQSKWRPWTTYRTCRSNKYWATWAWRSASSSGPFREDGTTRSTISEWRVSAIRGVRVASSTKRGNGSMVFLLRTSFAHQSRPLTLQANGVSSTLSPNQSSPT